MEPGVPRVCPAPRTWVPLAPGSPGSRAYPARGHTRDLGELGPGYTVAIGPVSLVLLFSLLFIRFPMVFSRFEAGYRVCVLVGVPYVKKLSCTRDRSTFRLAALYVLTVWPPFYI